MLVTPIGHAGILIQTEQATLVCDPWFVPAFFGSWFVFPRNDRLPVDVMDAVTHPDYLYVSHLHGDHFDEAFLSAHMDRDTTVLLPGFPGHEMEEQFRRLGFERFVRTRNGEEVDLGGGLSVAIHVETSITDGPGGDSAIVVSDGHHRVVNQNDCRTSDLSALAAHGPADLHFLQFSGAIWYPMVYDYPADEMRRLVDAKVDSQFTRALRYVEALDARRVVPSAGPPCFLDDDLFGFNVISGDELSIFPDQTAFLDLLARSGRDRGVLNIPGTTITLDGQSVEVTHPLPDAEVDAIFSDKETYLRAYQDDWRSWLGAHRSGWPAPSEDLLERWRLWWEPLMDSAPTLCDAIGGALLVRAGDTGDTGDTGTSLDVLVDFPARAVRPHAGEPYRFRLDIPRPLVESVVGEHAVDWSNSLFLSCRFRAWRDGDYNEYLYNFLKSLSPDRMRRAEAEARQKLAPPTTSEEIVLGDYVVERWCPHRRADLTVFGEIEGDELVCTLHGWRFDLDTGRCLTAEDRELRVRPRHAERSESD